MIVTLLPTWLAIIILMISQIIKDHFLSTTNLIIMRESLKAHHVVHNVHSTSCVLVLSPVEIWVISQEEKKSLRIYNVLILFL